MHILDSICQWYDLVFVFLWLISLSPIISSCIHVTANGIIPFFLWLNSMYVPHLLYTLTGRWLFRVFPHLSHCKQCCYEHRGACTFWIIVLSDVCPGVQLLDHMIILFFSFWGTFVPFPIVATYIPANSVGGCAFLHTLSRTCYL